MQACSVDGTDGWRWGAQGKCYTGPDAKQKALAQGIAMGDIDTGGKATGQKTAGPVLLSVKFAEERREATGVVAKAFDGTPDSLDLDGEAMDPADVFKLVRSYMLGGKLRGHDDQHDNSSDVGVIVEAFFNDDRVNSANFPKNSAVVTMRYTEAEWDLVKAGERTGFSFEAGVVPEIRTVELTVPKGQVRT